MKSLANIIFLLLIATTPVLGQQATNAEIQFQQDVHDFDTVNPGANRYSCVFHFTNTGTAPLIINDVLSSCGCTTEQS